MAERDIEGGYPGYYLDGIGEEARSGFQRGLGTKQAGCAARRLCRADGASSIPLGTAPPSCWQPCKMLAVLGGGLLPVFDLANAGGDRVDPLVAAGEIGGVGAGCWKA